VMCTSMAQYLEEMDNILKKNTVVKAPEELMELTSEGKLSNFEHESQFNLDQIPDQSIGFDFGHTSAFNGSVFAENAPVEEDKEADNIVLPLEEDNKSSIEEDLEKLKISKPKKRETKKEKTTKTKDSFKEPKAKSKVRVSDKERARKSRLRKKKYYEDLENKVHYLEDLCKTLTKEVQFYKDKIRNQENNADKNTFKTHLEREACIMTAMQERIKSIDHDDFKVFETINVLSKNF